ncbi:MAG: PAS domain-containing protein [Myxococcales bacterium]
MAREPLERLRERYAQRQREADEARLRLEQEQARHRILSSGRSASVGPPAIPEADEPYRALLEALSEGAARLAEDGTILWCNRHFAQLLEAPASELPRTDPPRLRRAGRSARVRVPARLGPWHRQGRGPPPAHSGRQ